MGKKILENSFIAYHELGVLKVNSIVHKREKKQTLSYL